MANKRLKRILCARIVLCLMFVSSFSVYYLTERSLIYPNVVYNGLELNYDTLKEFYSKERDRSSIDSDLDNARTEITDLYYFLSNSNGCVILTGTYIGRSPTNGGAEFKFQVNEVLLNSNDYPIKNGEKIQCFTSSDRAYYTNMELVFHSYGTEYEKGEQYLLFIEQHAPVNDQSDKPGYSFLGGPIAHDFYRFVYSAKLSGEYPSIKMFPGPIEYDATYFGAETKYVTADEFIDLIKNEIVLRKILVEE